MPDPTFNTRVAALFDRVADSYDNVGVSFFRPIAQRLVTEVAPAAGERALDIGCGRGAVLFLLAEAVGPSGWVTGIDLSPKMVETTGSDARARGLTNVDVRVMDASEPTLPPRTYDVVTASFMLFFLPDPVLALRRWWPLLEPGGRVGVSTFGAWDPRWEQLEDLFAPYLDARFSNFDPRDSTGPFGSDAGVEELMRAAGFTRPRTTHLDVDVVFEDAAQWYAWTRSHGQRMLWDSMADADRERVRTAAVERMEAWRDDHGRITMRQQIRFTLAERP